MESKAAVSALSALAHETRLAVFRSLVQAGQGGVAAGELARSLGVVANTMSAHLNILSHADLVTTKRVGRSIIYSLKYTRLSDLLRYLTQDFDGIAAQDRPLLAEIVLRAVDHEAPKDPLPKLAFMSAAPKKT